MKKTLLLIPFLAAMALVSCEGLGFGGDTYDLLPWAVVAPYMPYSVGDTCVFVSTDPVDSICVFTVSTVHRDPDSKEYNLNREDTSPENEHYAIMTSGKDKMEIKMYGLGDEESKSCVFMRVSLSFSSCRGSWGTPYLSWPDTITLMRSGEVEALLVRNKGLVWFKGGQGVSWTLKED